MRIGSLCDCNCLQYLHCLLGGANQNSVLLHFFAFQCTPVHKMRFESDFLQPYLMLSCEKLIKPVFKSPPPTQL